MIKIISATFSANGAAQQKQVMTSILTYPSPNQSVEDFENQMLPFAVAINNCWQPIRTWITVGLAIIVATNVLLMIVVARLFWIGEKGKHGN